MQSGYLFL